MIRRGSVPQLAEAVNSPCHHSAIGFERVAFFGELVSELGLVQPDDLVSIKIRRALACLANLTPGDFSAVRKRWRLTGRVNDPQALLDALSQDSALKPDGLKRVMGFTD